jgi:RepB DNA-primase from phage plasmid
MAIDQDAAIQFLRSAYEPDDWIALFLKSYATRRVAQRVVPVSLAMSDRIQEWLCRENAAGMNVYVSANAVRPRQAYRRRATTDTVHHLFLDADAAPSEVLAAISARRDLPVPSYVITSSAGRAHVLWRVRGFDADAIEALQRMLARQLQTDTAATSCAQLTRLPGFLNHKYTGTQPVTVDYREPTITYGPEDFPRPRRSRSSARVGSIQGHAQAVGRAREYAAALPAAVAGEHGDLLTFRLCCRLVRGFALTDIEAFSILGEWNARCDPPWTYRELRDKLNNARRYGREPVGGLLSASS